MNSSPLGQSLAVERDLNLGTSVEQITCTARNWENFRSDAVNQRYNSPVPAFNIDISILALVMHTMLKAIFIARHCGNSS